MGATYWVRLVLMAVILVAVVWSIRHLSPDKGVAGLVLCPSRVAALQSLQEKGGMQLEERGTSWVRISGEGQNVELDPIAVEKWFSRLCSLRAGPPTTESAAAARFTPVLKLNYVSGPPLVVLQSLNGNGGTTYQIRGENFAAKDLDEALRTLPSLPEATAPGHP